MRSPQVVVDWNGAIDAILQHKAVARPISIIGVTGPVGAGKSTLASRLSPCVLSSDNYLPDYDQVPYDERDDPARADLPRLAMDLANLASGRTTQVPIWSFQTHRREGERPIDPHRIVVCEGLHALHEPAASAMHLRVFVDAPRDVRWSRWEHIEATGQRGWGVEVAREFFNAVAEPCFERWAARLRASADIVVVNPNGIKGLPAL